jgi:hypothetical protein
MTFAIGTATHASDLLDKLHTFLTATGSAYNLAYTGTGNGTLTAYDGGADSVAETFTITASDATTFAVVGSVSGSLGNATVGSAFAHAKLNFLLTAGATPFVAGDTWTLNTAPKWTAQRAIQGDQYIWKAPGNDGLHSIYVGAKYYADAGADTYNWGLVGMTGYQAGIDIYAQPGVDPEPRGLPMWNTTIPYWFVRNGQRVIIAARIGTTYEHAYLGFINPYIDPGSYPYPLLVGGSVTAPTTRYSDGTTAHHAYWRGMNTGTTSANHNGHLRLVDGAWAPLTGSEITSGASAPLTLWPYGAYSTSFDNIRENLDGSYPLFPIWMSGARGTSPNYVYGIYGELDGLKATTGHANASENTITDGINNYVVFQDTSRTTKKSFVALHLD